MISTKVIIMIFALVCLFLQAFGVTTSRVSLGWLGMALWLLAVVLV
jgi:hypothetical protein